MSVRLAKDHERRLRAAVEAHLAGGRIRFRANPGEPKTVVWVDERVPKVQHTVMSIWGQERYAISAVEEKFQEMVREAERCRMQ